ncbi:NACHT, LRR and PYD domains-containing protein 3 [Geodia barretti]|uniref:NACHT, LRR and PYD domains-containing protein 3 n=1 Tax=Geodia barretti TaxID=519541 RepID=A0AA35XG62_GEOBA|nr:NACHT, LRR and PYD domains-containing protein 3 [Geodia barretti]
MIEMLKSPESQQDKTIGLVSQLEKKIGSYPDCLFVFIEVLLQNQALQSTGNEMLREAGKVCPDRVAVKFPSQLPTTDAMGSSMGRMAEELSIEKSSARKDGGRSSQQPSMFLGLTPVLAEYKEYLQSIYNARVLAAADKYLPTLDAPYINLAMIRRGQPYYHERRDEFTRRTLHGGVDQILESKIPINIEDLLTPKDSGRPVRFILVEGPPGIGKSTFAWEACRRWDEIESLRQYHTVVLLKLREKWVLSATQPSDLLRFPPKPELSTNIAEALNKSHGRNMLLVLDGFDEVSHSFHENSVIKSILCKQLWPECTIILTTRPSAKHTLKSICQPRVDKHVEIIGFTEEERVRYMTEVFSKEPELQVNFLKYMFHVPHIKSMMYIPLNCAIIAQVYYESQSSRHVGIPRTRTQLYKALTHSLLVRHMEMKEQNYDYSSMFPEGLNEEDKKDFKTLAKFAFYSYHGLKEDIHQILGRSSKKLSKSELWKVTFFKEDIPEGLIHFGFMNESTEMYAGKGVEETFSFLHLSLQEYLAAWHLAKSYSIEFQVAYHRLACVPQCGRPSATDVYKGDNREEKALISSLEPLGKSLVEPAIFLAGITGMRCQSGDDRNHWEMYLSLDIASIESARMVLLRSLYEAQNQTMRPRIYNCNIVSSFPTPYDCYALSYCVSHLDQFNLTVFIEDGDDVSLLETFVKGLEDHRKSTTPKIKFLHLNCGYVANAFNRCIYWLNKVDIDTFCLESTVLKYAIDNNLLQSLVKFESLEIDNSDLRSWEWLPSLKSLTELKALSITNIASEEYMSPPPTEDLCWLLEHRLTEMKLDLQTSTDTLVDSVLKSALKSKQITKLELPSISRKAMASVHSIILHCPSLTTLRLEDTRLGYDGILYICSALRFNTTLRHLVILEDVQRPIPYRLGRGHTMSMKRVPLPGKATCTDFLLELNNILKDNTTLEEIKIQSGLFLPLSAA